MSSLIPPPPPRFEREDGQTIIEYAMVLGVISIVLIGVIAVTGLADDFETLVGNIFPG